MRSKPAVKKKPPTPVRAPGPAKLSAPTAERVFPRTRLFKQLDRALARNAVVWIGTPGGYGKTLLAASYLKARKYPHLWYQIDPGDADAASFFHNLGLAAQPLAPRRRLFPALTPEYLKRVANAVGRPRSSPASKTRRSSRRLHGCRR